VGAKKIVDGERKEKSELTREDPLGKMEMQEKNLEKTTTEEKEEMQKNIEPCCEVSGGRVKSLGKDRKRKTKTGAYLRRGKGCKRKKETRPGIRIQLDQDRVRRGKKGGEKKGGEPPWGK